MKSTYWSHVLLAVGLVVGFLVGAGVLEHRSHAQAARAAAPAQRFQIFAWANPGRQRGCYIVDTVTGELWHASDDNTPQKISQKLR